MAKEFKKNIRGAYELYANKKVSAQRVMLLLYRR